MSALDGISSMITTFNLSDESWTATSRNHPAASRGGSQEARKEDLKMKLFKAFMARALGVKTDIELNILCADIDRAYQSGKLKADENELLYRLINRLH